MTGVAKAAVQVVQRAWRDATFRAVPRADIMPGRLFPAPG